MNKTVRSTLGILLLIAASMSGGCELFAPPKYGTEQQLFLPAAKRQVWAIAPAMNLSGQKAVDPILQADLVYQQLQQVHGLTVVPVNRVVEVTAGLKLEKVQSAEQAAVVCDLLGCDALLIPTVTAYDPYDPPKMGASVQVFFKPRGFSRAQNVDVRELARSAAPLEDKSLPPPATNFMQAVAMFDASNGSTRDAVRDYARGRSDPLGPMGAREYLANMDRYGGFVYNALIIDLLRQMDARERPVVVKK